MTPEEFIERARDPNSWFYMADGLLRDHGTLLDRSMELRSAVFEEEYSSSEEKNLLSRGAASSQNSAAYLVAMALENALKGHLLLEKPEAFQITLKRDAAGEPKEVEFRGEEGRKLTHNLTHLCKRAGLFNEDKNPVLGEEILGKEMDRERFENILTHLEHMISWGGRYPVPHDLSTFQEWEEVMPPGTEEHLKMMDETHNVAAILVDHLLPRRKNFDVVSLN